MRCCQPSLLLWVGVMSGAAERSNARNCPSLEADIRLDGATAIARYVGKPARWVYQCRERGWSAPIRKQEGLGLYAFASELDAWLRDPASLGAAHKH